LGIALLYLHKSKERYHTKICFGRKPASTRSDWHFTAYQNSSENYATFTRSIYYNLVLVRSPGFGSNRSNLPITICSSVAFAKVLSLLLLLTCWPIMQKVRRHFIIKTSTAYRVTNSSLFHYVNTILFKLSFTVLFAIAKFIILSLRGWFPFIPTSFLSSYFLFSLIINLQDFHLF